MAARMLRRRCARTSVSDRGFREAKATGGRVRHGSQRYSGSTGGNPDQMNGAAPRAWLPPPQLRLELARSKGSKPTTSDQKFSPEKLCGGFPLGQSGDVLSTGPASGLVWHGCERVDAWMRGLSLGR